jgi:hypothetical protein
VAEMFADFFDSVFYQQDCMPRGTFKAFENYMRVIRNSPIFEEYINSYAPLYPQKFINRLNKLKRH